MTAFYLAAAALTLLVLAVLLWPLLRSRKGRAAMSVQQLNSSVYRDQLKELDRDLARGQLAQANYDEARDELQRRLLQDMSDLPAGGPAAAPARAGLATVIVLALAVPLGAVGLYAGLGNSGAIDYQPTDNSPQKRAERAIEELRKSMETPPSKPEEWIRVGRAFAGVARFNDAVRAFNRADELVRKDADLLVELADLMTAAANDQLEGRPMELVRQALALNPKHPMGLMLTGTSAYRRGEYAAAIAEWEKLLTVLPPGTRDVESVQANIEQARGDMARADTAKTQAAAGAVATKLAQVARGDDASKEASKEAGKDASKAPGEAKTEAASGMVSGEVVITRELAAKIGPDDTLFIIARAGDGSRVPLAVLRKKASELPFKFTLDDSQAMMPQRTLSKAESIVLLARVSKSGQPMAQPGDLISETGVPVKPGTTGLRLVIDRQL